MLAQYAGVGGVCPAWGVQVENGGELAASGTIYFSFQLQNRAGFNSPATSGAIAYSANQKIIITIPSSARKAGWDIHYFVLSAGTTSDPSTHVQVARYPGYQYGVGIESQSLESSLPASIELSKDAHIALAPTVPSIAALPSGSDQLDGQVRWVTAESKWFEYRADSTLSLAVDVIAADIGQWVRIGGASPYVSNTRTGVGSDRPIASINPATTIPTPPYPGQTLGKFLPGWEAKYWIYNNNSIALPVGTEFGIELEFNGKRSLNLLNGLFMVKFIGFVGSDGAIRTTDSNGLQFKNCGAYFPWTPKVSTPFVTSDDLQPGEAIALAVKPFFSAVELDDGANTATPKSVVGVYPVTRSQSGDYNPLGKLLPGGTVYAVGDKYRVVPNSGLSFDILKGSAIVGSYDFPEKPRRTFSGLLPSTAGQKIIINGNGAVYAESPSYTPTESEAIRAIVSTAAGESAVGTWSSYGAIASAQSAQVAISYPYAQGYGIIRSDYPDVIAGNAKAIFNAGRINIYLQRQDTLEIRKFSGLLVISATSQEFNIASWSSGTVVPELPTAETDFGLFAPGTAAIAPSSGGNFPATSYRAAFSFAYDGNQISKISHASPPCIKEWYGDFQPATISIGTVTTLEPGVAATITNSGTGNEPILNFGIPRGADGVGGGGGGFGGIITCTDGSPVNGAGKAFLFYRPQTDLALVVQPSFDISISSGSDSIQIHRWSQEPNIELNGREFLAELPSTGGNFTVDIDTTYRWISIFAKNPNNAIPNAFDCVYITHPIVGNVFTLIDF